MLTIIIFSNSRYHYLFSLLQDLSRSRVNICIVDFGKKKDKIQEYKKIKKKNIKLIFNDKCSSFAQRFVKYLKSVKTKYVWFIGDDDRIESTYLDQLLIFLKNNNYSGLTLGHISFDKDFLIKKKKQFKKIKSNNLNIFDEIHNLGMMSAQIINVKNFQEISKDLNKKILIKYGYPHLYIIIKMIEKFKNWQKLENKIVYYRFNNINKDKKSLLNRLNCEFNGYLLPLKETYDNDKIKNLYKKIFFNNIISWIILCITIVGRKETLKILIKNNKIVPFIFYIYFLQLIFLVLPIKIILILKKIKNDLFFKESVLKNN